jgi:hypothetical protein
MILINSAITITLILNQNDSSKDATTNQNSSSLANPLENVTWICFILQLILLLIKTKITDF